MSQKTDKPLDTKTKADVKASSAPNTTAQTHVDTKPATETPETPQQAEMQEALVKPETGAPENTVAPDNADATSNADVSDVTKEAHKPIDTTRPLDAAEAAVVDAVDKTTAKTTSAKTVGAGGLPADLLELVNELRDTVKGINPKKHTLKTLKRALANVSDILTDIEKIYHKS